VPGLAPYRTSDEDETLAYLARRPYDNAYVAWLLATRQIGRRDDVVLWRNDYSEVSGFAVLTSRIIPCADSGEALATFADLAKARVREPRMIVGSRDGVEGFWARAKASMRTPFTIRAAQPVFAILGGDAQDAADPHADIAVAREHEVDELAVESAQMTSGELGYTIVADSAYRRRIGGLVAAGWFWRYRIAGKLAFMCHVAAETAQTVHLQSVWTPPPMRGNGYATIALGAICARLLQRSPSVSLYVNDFNASAIALYERVGFTRVGTMSTIIFT
jgi:RimJ/RimL family protein N-acetyltransferase